MGNKMVQIDLITFTDGIHALLNLKNDKQLSISLRFYFFQYTNSIVIPMFTITFFQAASCHIPETSVRT